ncbi:ERO1-like protein beta [Patella vulgata]|uniref:ERO1-like protein beta n=1 Tax=Patella vulgata TaxID=6465 RepID=UPI0024A7D01C|nr:ERO1-like protein beta [Patella vulgata]
MKFYLGAILLVLFIDVTFQEKNNKSKSSKAADRCFCKLKGEIDDCTCKVETISDINNNKIYPRLKSLLSRNYFRYFKVNLKKPCPFWPDDSRCALKDCHVDKCKEEEVPIALKKGHDNKYSKEAQNKDSCEEERELGALNTSLSDESKQAFKDWNKYDESQELFCDVDDESSAGMEYVDLLLNPERYTGYKGDSPHRIWRSIYEENCFTPQPDIGYGPSKKNSPSLCLEKRTFHRLISGLHTSINIHLCYDYLFQGNNIGYGDVGKWEPNIEEFKKRFDPKTTSGAGPQRLKNLFFTYLVELRALAKAAPYLEQEDFFTGDTEEDLSLKEGIKDVLSIIKSFPDQFDESKLFAGNPVEAKLLKEEFRNHFRNVSRIMDCVGCDKCKLWGKLQTQGMGTALKILFSGDDVGPDSTVNAHHKKQFQLTRSEIFTLFNAFGRLSKSVHSLEKFKSLLNDPM